MMTIYLNRRGRTYLDLDIQYNVQPEVFEDPIIRKALHDVDRVIRISGMTLETSEYGVLAPGNLSNGCKALILCWYDAKKHFDFLVSNSCMGENVLPHLAALSLKYDFRISMDYPMLFPEDDTPLLAQDADTGTVFHTGDEILIFYAGRAGRYTL